MSTHVFLAGLSHQVCPPALLFRLGSRKVRRYKNTWIRNSSDAMAQQEWKVVRRRRSSEGACSTSPIFSLAPLFQTCPPPPWQELRPRARTSPPGGWSSPARKTCRQVWSRLMIWQSTENPKNHYDAKLTFLRSHVYFSDPWQVRSEFLYISASVKFMLKHICNRTWLAKTWLQINFNETNLPNATTQGG